MSVRSLPGGVPEPDELFGREHLIDVLWRQLEGNNIMLVAPRRFGKTGVMRHVLKRPREAYLPVYVDAEELHDPASFAAELIAAVLHQAPLRRFLNTIKGLPKDIVELVTTIVDEASIEQVRVKLRKSLGDSWEDTAKRLILEMKRAEKTVIFIIDELPQFLDNVSRKQGDESAQSLLAWFRSVRMQQKDQLRRFRFIVGGSTSIDMILRRLNVPDKLNDFFRLPVGPLTQTDAEALLTGLSESYHLDFTDDGKKTFFRLIGPPVPYFIHLFVSQILLNAGLKGRPLSPTEVEEVYRKQVIGPSCRGYFDYYRQRLKRYGPAGERSALAILRTIADAPNGRVSDSALFYTYSKGRRKGASDIEFLEIMADLECDWYVALDTTTNEYFFLLDVMKAWWNRFYRSLTGKGK